MARDITQKRFAGWKQEILKVIETGQHSHSYRVLEGPLYLRPKVKD